MTQPESTSNVRLGQVWLGASAGSWYTLGATLGVAGLGGSSLLGLWNPKVFFHAYLVAFLFFLSITLGALFFVLLQHLSRAGWSASLRRLAEALSGNIVLMALLAIPLVLGMGSLYEWSHADVVAGDKVLQGKAVYLNTSAFILRLAGYFVVWGVLAWFLRSRSIRQDESGDVRLSRSVEAISAPGMLLFAFTVTFAAFDLLMSLQPHWFSTVFGVYFFTGCVLSAMVSIILLACILQWQGLIKSAITTEHYHDLGKLTFAFVFFWGYIAFSQYMLIWYANLPEETQFYAPRQLGPWAVVSLVLLFVQLVIPFAGLLSRWPKRSVNVLGFWCAWLLVARLVDLYWLVMPNLFIQEIPHVVHAPHGTPLSRSIQELVASSHSVYEVSAKYPAFAEALWLPLSVRTLVIVLGLVVGMGGLYLISTAWMLQGAALVPQRDPRLSEALAFENT